MYKWISRIINRDFLTENYLVDLANTTGYKRALWLAGSKGVSVVTVALHVELR